MTPGNEWFAKPHLSTRRSMWFDAAIFHFVGQAREERRPMCLESLGLQ